MKFLQILLITLSISLCNIAYVKANGGGLIIADNKDAFSENSFSPDTKVNEYVDQHNDLEQLRIDTIVRTFKKLPAAEIESIGVDIETPVLSGTERAKELFRAWKQRQEEFRQAVESMVSPIKHMKSISTVLQNKSSSDEQLIDTLKELESLVTDVDNARDFHTIGGWEHLVRLLGSDQDPRVRSYAAWSIGSAIKNNYDYQLWTIQPPNATAIESEANELDDLNGHLVKDTESPVTSKAFDSAKSTATALDALLRMLSEYSVANSSKPDHSLNTDENLVKKSLYALSAAVRGNTDVQEYIHASTIPGYNSFGELLTSILQSNRTTLEITRKTWSLVADMLEERRYIQEEVLSNKHLLQVDVRTALESLPLLGDQFCLQQFTWNTWKALQVYIDSSSSSSKLTAVLNELQTENSENSSVIQLSHESEGKKTSSDLQAYRAVLEHIAVVFREQSSQCAETLLKTSPAYVNEAENRANMKIDLDYHMKTLTYVDGLLGKIIGHSNTKDSNADLDASNTSVSDADNAADGVTFEAVDDEMQPSPKEEWYNEVPNISEEIVGSVRHARANIHVFIQGHRQECLLLGQC